MSDEEKSKDTAGSKETKRFETPKALFNSSSLGLTNPSSVLPHLAPDREEDDSQDAEGMKWSLRQMGIRPPRLFDPKKSQL